MRSQQNLGKLTNPRFWTFLDRFGIFSPKSDDLKAKNDHLEAENDDLEAFYDHLESKNDHLLAFYDHL